MGEWRAVVAGAIGARASKRHNVQKSKPDAGATGWEVGLAGGNGRLQAGQRRARMGHRTEYEIRAGTRTSLMRGTVAPRRRLFWMYTADPPLERGVSCRGSMRSSRTRT